uniref:AlNc14C147G7432 protein n=1 Tax=Albugo laibachii Nc14 TaxID=890382 RepID=F0WLP7_9STRA|nr:AlNc14C147G7432 [Albugo laibachii Nc14]|eukprot:CCA22213.1 AlNc14C147G7432 [Albugo laibachii Nc14]
MSARKHSIGVILDSFKNRIHVVIALSFSAALFSNFNINQSNIQVKDFGRMMKPLCVRYGSGKGERKLQCGIVRICLSLESFHITHFPSTSLTLFNLIG